MRKTGARLTLSGAMARQTQLEPLESFEMKSSSQTKAEREIKLLKQENQKLRTDLADVRSLYNQLIQENSHEKFDERRVTLLKSQIIQLERQLLLFSEALSSRSETLFEVENNLHWLADKCRSLISKEVHGPHVPVERSELTLMVETAESARIKLYKQIENRSTENLSRPFKFTSDFLQCSKESNVTLLEVASGNLEHLNLKHVAKLETKLSSLYKDLIHLHSIMETEINNDSAYLWTSCHVTTAARERLMTQVLKSCALMKDCSSDLLDLSVLYPSAPWPPLKRCALKEITAERVLGCMSSRSRSRSEDVNRLIQALVKAFNYKVYMLQNKNKCLREEVKYHQRVYNLQLKYTASLFQAIREAYTSFEETSNDLIVKPVNVVLEAYMDLNQSASEVSLKTFIQTFKDQVPQLSNIVETLQLKHFEESDGSKVLSQYGDEFFEALEKVVQSEQSRRDIEAGRIEEIRNEQSRLDIELRELLEEQEQRLQQNLMTSSEPTLQNDTSSEIVNNLVNTDRSDVDLDKGKSDLMQESEQTVKRTKPRSKQKPLHTKEWVNILDDQPIERGMSDLNLDHTERSTAGTENCNNEMSNAELYNYHAKADLRQEVHTNNEVGDINVSEIGETSAAAEKPPKIKKKKLGYVPNTFVPNKTLQLRRSGSLSRLSSKDEGFDSKLTTDSRPVSQEEVPIDKTRTQTQGKNIPRSRPVFR
ncbi:girdin-like [Mercenaria mercenaria]|uniref:girdin-like n=1 Tax=Mercenaria mercenaria TaxID=6596 RepID=UPI00234F3EBC|nr:girdin-like [Mercenaria mercenaria]XP_045216265.2 girdin-like [Mercenaria mercenaria]